jgi:hypothetical protein
MASVTAMLTIAVTIELAELIPAAASSSVLGPGIPLPHHCSGHGGGTVPCQKGWNTCGKHGHLITTLIAWGLQ